MKTKINLGCTVCSLALLSLTAPRALAAETPSRATAAEAPDVRMKYEAARPIRALGQPPEKEIVTFLGVETAPVSPTLSAQLGLPKDSGLVVISIVPESPAAGALRQHDVLVKLDDQILVDSRQFSVLVRNHKENDEVTFTYIRTGKQATAKVKLGKHEVPKMAMLMGETFGTAGQFDVLINRADQLRGSREETDRVLGLLEGGAREVRPPGGPGGQPQRFTRELRREGPGFRAIAISPANSNLVFTDEQGSLDLTIKDGKKTLVAKNPKGEQIFSGPVNTPEERNALSPETRQRLDRLEGMQDFTFKTEEGFTPTTRTIRTFPQGIAFPLPEPGFHEAVPAPQVF